MPRSSLAIIRGNEGGQELGKHPPIHDRWGHRRRCRWSDRASLELCAVSPPTYPFAAVEVPEGQRAEFEVRGRFLDQMTVENEAYSNHALVIINFQKKGNAEQYRADSTYGTRMMSMLAEVGYGPVYLDRPVSLENDADFDTVVVVACPGIRYFTEMVQSRFYTRIFGGKQLNEDLSSPRVPIL